MSKETLPVVCGGFALRKMPPVFSVILATMFFCTDAFATDWAVPKNFTKLSENGLREFRITLGKDYLHPGHCNGALYVKKGKSWKLQWERPLINDVRPIRAFVSNSGKYVVTVGEWEDFERLPIVIYGGKGYLINAYGSLQPLVPFSFSRSSGRVAGERIRWTKKGRDWLSHCLLFFGPKEQYFIVRLSTGKVLVFETQSGQFIDDKWKEFCEKSPNLIGSYRKLENNLKRLIITEALKCASSGIQEDKDNGLFVLKQYKDLDSISVLKEAAMKDPTFRIVDTPQGEKRVYPIRQAAKEALKMIEETASKKTGSPKGRQDNTDEQDENVKNSEKEQ